MFMSILCKFCNHHLVVKNGIISDKQRYRCRSCNRSFRLGDNREKYSEEIRLKVIKLYLENCGIQSIERLTGIYNSLISSWIRRYGYVIKNKLNKDLSNLKKKDIRVLEIDGLVTYIKKNKEMEEDISLYGLLSTGTKTELLILK